jgi:uncharacterized repeat protein (TIGR01451 family)
MIKTIVKNIKNESKIGFLAVIFGLAIMPIITNASVTSILAYPPLYNSVTYNSAILRGSVTENSDPSTCAWFEYSPSTFYQSGPITATQEKCGIISYTAFNFDQFIDGLTPGTTYNFRVAAKDSLGLHYSASQTFTTLSPTTQNNANNQTSYNPNNSNVIIYTQPTTITNAAMLVHENSAVINGTVNPGNNSTSAWFEWSSDPNLANANKSIPENIGSDNTDKYLAYALSNLTLGQTYYFRAVAQNSYGTTYGTVNSFTTRVAPVAVISTPAASTYNSPAVKTTSTQATTPNSLISLEAEFNTNSIRPGKEAIYNISYENTGNSNASNVILVVTLPNEAAYESSSFANVSKNENKISFKIGDLASKSSGIISVKFKVMDLTKANSLIFNDSVSYLENGIAGNGILTSELKLNLNSLTASVIDLLGNTFSNGFFDLLMGILIGFGIYHFAFKKKQVVDTEDPLK